MKPEQPVDEVIPPVKLTYRPHKVSLCFCGILTSLSSPKPLSGAYLFFKCQLANKGSRFGVRVAPVATTGAIWTRVHWWRLAVENSIICDNVLGIYYFSPSEETNEAVQHRASHFWSEESLAQTK